MKARHIQFFALLSFLIILLSCDDEKDELSSIVGRWSGDKADFQVNLIPLSEDDFDIVLDFKTDGTLTLTEDGNSVSGTYVVKGDQLTITGVTVGSIPIAIAGDYDIKKLNATNLVIEGEREGEINDPTYGTISGKVKATLYFDKMNP
jgi:hypothetical protein